VHDSLRVRRDFEIVDPAKRRAQLVLDSALDTEDVTLEPMRRIGNFPRRQLVDARGGQRSQ